MSVCYRAHSFERDVAHSCAVALCALLHLACQSRPPLLLPSPSPPPSLHPSCSLSICTLARALSQMDQRACDLNRTVSRMALLLDQMAGAVRDSLGALAAAALDKTPAPERSKSHAKSKHYVPAVGDEVVYIRAGHRQHLREKTQPPRPWDAEAEGGSKHYVTCFVEHVSYYNPVALNVFKARDFADEGEKEPKSQPCICVRLRPSGAKRKTAGAACPASDASFHVSVYQESSLPEFLVKKAVFEQSCKLKPATRVKMWFATVDSSRKPSSKAASGTWYLCLHLHCTCLDLLALAQPSTCSLVPVLHVRIVLAAPPMAKKRDLLLVLVPYPRERATYAVWHVVHRYQGSVVSNTFPEDAQPWECILVRWDKHEELTRVCPWELTANSPADKEAKDKGE